MLIFKNLLTDKTAPTTTPEGYLTYKGINIARTGLQDYRAGEFGDAFFDREPSAVVKVYRPESEVFDEEAMASFENKPITNNHPPVPVTAANYKNLAVGHANNIRRDGDYLVADLTIIDPGTIADIMSGKKELSNGYVSALDIVDGETPNGEKYNAIQREIRGNHIAVVQASRCGTKCSLFDTQSNHNEEKLMRILINGIPFEVADESLAAAIQGMQDTHTTVIADADTVKTQLKSVEEKHADEIQTLQALLDTALSNVITPEKLDAIADERVQIITDAKKLVPELEVTGKTCMAIKRETIATLFGDSITEDKLKNDVYVNARFDGALAAAPTSPTSPLTNIMVDSASSTVHDSKNPVAVAQAKKKIGNSIAHRFTVSQVSHRATAFVDAIDKEYEARLKAGTLS